MTYLKDGVVLQSQVQVVGFNMTTKDDKIHDVILDELKGIRLENKEARKDASKARKIIADELNDLNKKLFIGNGSPSWNSRILKNTLVVKAIVFAVSVLYVAIIGAVVTFTVSKLTEKDEPIQKITMSEEK